MGAIVTFNFQNWITRYPEFANVDSNLAQQYFNEASIYFANDGSGPVNNLNEATVYLNMLTAHICALNKPADASSQASTPIVGRISSATEGSVTVQVENDYPAGSAQWYQQTKYGSAYWTAIKKYRRFLYLAHPQRVAVGPFGGFSR